MNAQVLIVDGHSMIFQWPPLRELHQRKTSAARDRLIELMARFQDATGIHVTVVFDGTGPRANRDESQDRLQVFYSGASQTADSVIERLVAKYAPQYSIIVATDDNLERTTVETFGGAWISSEQLEGEIKSAQAALDDRIARLRRR